MLDDEIDPIEEVQAIRQKIWRRHKTVEAYFAHLKNVPSADVLLTQVRAKIAKAKETEAKPTRRPVSRRRKTLV